MGLGTNYNSKVNFNNGGSFVRAGAANVYTPIEMNYPKAEIIVTNTNETEVLFNEERVAGEIDPKTNKIKPGTDKKIVATTTTINIDPVTGEFNKIVETNEYLKPYDGMTEYEMKEQFVRDHFDGKYPSSLEEILPYIEEVEIDYNDMNGVKKTTTIRVHKGVADQVQKMMSELQKTGFRIENNEYGNPDICGFNEKDITNTDVMSQHELGFAIDINTNKNACIVDGKNTSGGVYDYNAYPDYTLTQEHAKIFIKYGYFWGGTWSTKKDYMHISCTGF